MSRDPVVRGLEVGDCEAVLRLIAPEIPELRLDSEDVRRNLFEDPALGGDLLLCACDGGAIRGVACGVLRERDGYLKLLVVAPEWRRRGLGSRMLEDLTTRLAQAGASRVQTDGAAPVYFLPGVPVRAVEGRRFLEARGFRELEARGSMTCNLDLADLDTSGGEAKLEARGIAVRRATIADSGILRREISSLFSSDWAIEVDLGLRIRGASVHLAFEDGRLAGFAAGGIWARNAFGPMGTSPDHEGLGIGEVLLKRCLHDLRSAGEASAVIAWIGPEEFYSAKVGARTDLRYVVLVKDA